MYLMKFHLQDQFILSGIYLFIPLIYAVIIYLFIYMWFSLFKCDFINLFIALCMILF